jgi:hypothetical protein
MRLPFAEGESRRTAFYAVLLIVLIIGPTILGFTVASAGVSQPPDPNTAAPTASASSGTSEVSSDPQLVVTQVPVGDAPSTASEALTRQDDAVAGIPRLRYITPETGEVRLNNGDTIPLGDDIRMTLNVSPFPPDAFDVDVEIELTRDGQPITDASINTVWDMIVMGHGPFVSPIPHQNGGTYTVHYDMFMFGPWQLDTTLSIPGLDPIEFALSLYVWPA